METITKYNNLKLDIKNANWWLNMIGKDYNGGGGGVGSINKLTISSDVYFQEYDGATNYHDIPEGLKKYLSKAVFKNFNKLKQEALDLMEIDRLELAKKVKQEHEILMKEAGLTV